mgnify:CR=1 FL=1
MQDPVETITSPSNPLIKRLRGLERKKQRQETGLFMAEGARLVAQGLARGWRLDTLVLSRPAMQRDHAGELADRARRAGARVVCVPERLVGRITRKDNPQAVIGAFEQAGRRLDALSGRAAGLWIALHEVRDPGNLGTILRTADCAGLGGVILTGACCDPYSVEAVRASMGSIFDMPFAEAGFDALDDWRKRQGARLVAASMNGNVRHDGNIYGPKAVILMGNEQSGLPAPLEAACDTLAQIPMRGGADSLNLAQASAVMIYEAWRQRGFA